MNPRAQESPATVVAIKKGQTEISAPSYDDWVLVRCTLCSAEFQLGKRQASSAREGKEHYVKFLQQILVGEHSREEKPDHLNRYDLRA